MRRRRLHLILVGLCGLVFAAGAATANDDPDREDYRSSTYDYGGDYDYLEGEYDYYDQYEYDEFAEDEYESWDEQEDVWADEYDTWDQDRGGRGRGYDTMDRDGYYPPYGYVPQRDRRFGAWEQPPRMQRQYDTWRDDESYWTEDWYESQDAFSEWYEGDWF